MHNNILVNSSVTERLTLKNCREIQNVFHIILLLPSPAENCSIYEISSGKSRKAVS